LARLTRQNVLTALAGQCAVESYNVLISNYHLQWVLLQFPTWLLLDLLGAGHVELPWVRILASAFALFL